MTGSGMVRAVGCQNRGRGVDKLSALRWVLGDDWDMLDT